MVQNQKGEVLFHRGEEYDPQDIPDWFFLFKRIQDDIPKEWVAHLQSAILSTLEALKQPTIKMRQGRAIHIGWLVLVVLAISPLAAKAKLCPKVSSSAFQSINLILWNLLQRASQPIGIFYRYFASVKGAFLLSQNQVRTRKSAFFKKIEKIFEGG